ncbi:Dom-3 Z [Borealophlyctis nickersoniae]|nr:Dom-3 Z [Borealophlyctis nickersoniae]
MDALPTTPSVSGKRGLTVSADDAEEGRVSKMPKQDDLGTFSQPTSSSSQLPPSNAPQIPIAFFGLDTPETYRPKHAKYQQPTEIGYFCYDGQRNLKLMDDSELNYYYPPDVKNCNLSEGYPDRFVTRDPTPERLDALLKCLQHLNQDKAKRGREPYVPKFCTWRGIMTKIFCTPYSRNDRWELGATLYKGTIYLEEHESEEKRNSLYGSTDRNQLMTYWGYKFESACTINKPPPQVTSPNDPDLEQRKTGIVNTNIQYCSVFKTKLGQHSLVMGGEVDCLVGDSKPKENRQSQYAELKTNRVITNDRQKKSFEKFKLLKIWAQSFLAGVPKIIVGFRDDNGNLKVLEHFKTMDLPRMVRDKPDMWDALVCINFANQLLDWIVENVTVDDPDVVYTIRFAPPFERVEIIGPQTGGDMVFVHDCGQNYKLALCMALFGNIPWDVKGGR